MRRWWRVWLRGACALLLLGAGMGPARAAQDQPTATKTKDGLHFNLPSDWPVEKRDGVVGPVPVEEYLTRRFNVLDSRLRVVEDQMNSFDVRLRVLEEQLKKQRRLQSSEPNEGAAPTP